MFFLFLAFAPLYAQEASGGVITGRVVEASSGSPLPGTNDVRWQVEGSHRDRGLKQLAGSERGPCRTCGIG